MGNLNTLDTGIGKLYGVGKVREATYAKMGIRTVRELLEHYPRGYENRGDVRLLADASPDVKTAVVLTVATEPRVAKIKNRMTLLKFKAYDESGFCEITFFNQDYLRNSFPLGSEFRFYGKVQQSRSSYVMTSPVFEPYGDGSELTDLFPVYPLTEGLTQKQIVKDMKSALVIAAYASDTEDYLPEDIRRRHSLCTLAYAQRSIHSPDGFAALAAARKRLVFDELFTFALGISLVGAKPSQTYAPPCPNTDTSALESLLPYSLTSAQRRAITQIKTDMSADVAMNRMLVGDVGCGKTVVAAIAMYIAVKNGRQAALMAPTEILASQHFTDMRELFERLGVRCELLIGSLSAAQKKKIHASLTSGDTDVVIGTQALLSEGVDFARVGLVVADEQHRFGVDQRAVLAEKNGHSHMLVMSATPIPRSLALAIYGNLDVSRIDEMPSGRQRVDTFAVDESYRERLNSFISKQVDSGGRVYIVCPAVEERLEEEADVLMDEIDGEGRMRSATPLKSAIGYAEKLSETFPQYSIAFLHGKMKGKEKDDVMRRFADGDIQILVSTTVIEVGVNVPEACLMIVENADRFGLSQLHQLRGRVGRGKRKSYCVLVSDAINAEGKAKERLLTMKKCYDGFEIAEKDLLMRGPGDFLRGSSDEAVRQSGGIRLKLSELCDDASLMQCAFDEAKALLDGSPELTDYPLLLARVNRMFTLESGTVN